MKTAAKDWFALSGEGCANIACGGCERIVAYSSAGGDPDIGTSYVTTDYAIESGAKKLYVPSLDIPDKDIDKLIDYSLSVGAELLAVCGSSLTEMGIIDARFGKSPVMLLHEFGLLGQSRIISGVYLDKDDLALMSQEGVSLTVLPTSDAGCGNGIAPVCAAVKCGVTVRIGTGSGLYNRTRNVIQEAAFLRIALSAQLNKKDAITPGELAKMCVADNATPGDIVQTEKLIKEF